MKLIFLNKLKNITKKVIVKRISLIEKFGKSYSYYKNNFNNNSEDTKSNMSKIYNVNFDKIFSLLETLNLEPRNLENEIKIKYCPLCLKPHNNDPTNFYTMNISKLKNVYNCFRCCNKGHVFQLVKKLNKDNPKGISGYTNGGSTSSNEVEDFNYHSNNSNNIVNNDVVNKNFDESVVKTTFNNININLKETEKSSQYKYKEKIIVSDEKNIHSPILNSLSLPIVSNFNLSENIKLLNEMYKRVQGVHNSNNKLIFDYIINERKLSLEALEKYKVGISFERFTISEGKYYNLPCVTFPMFLPVSSTQIYVNFNGSINETIYDFFNSKEFILSKVKVRAIGKELKRFQRIEPTGAIFQGMFGLDIADSIIKENNLPNEIVITEGEFDAIAVYQDTGLPAVSLPNGCSNLPVELLPLFKKYSKIYLWTDSDQAGKIASENFAKKLGIKKTYIVNTRKNDPNGPKDANDCLKNGISLMKYIKEAKLLAGENVIKFDDIRSEILQFLSQYDLFSGYKSTSFPFFNERLKGLRNGEFTVLTGETGCGKTTFLAQLSLDFLEQRIPTLWGSFEIKNDKLASMFLMQMAQKDLVIF